VLQGVVGLYGVAVCCSVLQCVAMLFALLCVVECRMTIYGVATVSRIDKVTALFCKI